MNFENSLIEGKVKKVTPNNIRASSLFKSSIQAIETAKAIQLNSNTLKSILRELYEGLREYCEAVGYLHGYKFLDHESIGYFLRDILKEQSLSMKFDRYRKLRNGINYYGEDVDIETVKEAIIEIPELIKELGKFPEAVVNANKQLSPHLIANYTFQLSQKFNEFYHACPVLTEKEPIRSSRLAIVQATKYTLASALSLLGIEAPEKM